MFSTIVVGVNGAGGGADAMALAQRLASPDSELVAVSVAVVGPHLSSGANLDADRDARQEAQARLEVVREQEPNVHGEVLTARSVADGLHDATERFEADLIVIGSSRRAARAQIFAGDDTRGTLRGAPCPVAMAPRDFALRSTAITTIGVGWDGGPEADRALDIANALAADVGAHVHALAVVGMPAWPVADVTPAVMEVPADVQRADERRTALESVEVTTATGVAVDELAHFAGEVDLLVVGSRQRGLLGRVALGSTSEQLTRRCVRPLIVVPRTLQQATHRR